MDSKENRVLGRILAVEEVRAVSGAVKAPPTLPYTDTNASVDTSAYSDSGMYDDSGTYDDTGTILDTTVYADSISGQESNPSHD
jgi:hypothetical protein